MTNADRQARKERAQRDGRRRAAQQRTNPPKETPMPTKAPVVPPSARVARPRAAKEVVVTDTVERQASAAVARINAAEAARAPKPPARPATVKAAAKRLPTQRDRTTRDTPVAPVSVHDAVQHMELSHIQCRDFGHSWRPFTARWLPSFNQYESQLICQRCNTVRTRFLSRTGANLSTNYDYADGYTVKGLGRLSGEDRDVIRLQSIQAVLVEDTASEG